MWIHVAVKAPCANNLNSFLSDLDSMEMNQETTDHRENEFVPDDEIALRQDIFFWYLE
jgi:hypothetical protein